MRPMFTGTSATSRDETPNTGRINPHRIEDGSHHNQRYMSLSTMAKASAKRLVIKPYDITNPRLWARDVVDTLATVEAVLFLQISWVSQPYDEATPLGVSNPINRGVNQR